LTPRSAAPPAGRSFPCRPGVVLGSRATGKSSRRLQFPRGYPILRNI